MSAEIVRGDKNEIKRIVYTDSTGDTLSIEPKGDDKVSVTTRTKGGSGYSTVFDKREAKRVAHDIIEVAGGE